MPLSDAAFKCLIGTLSKLLNSWCFCSFYLHMMNPAEKAVTHVCMCLHSKPLSESCGLLR